ncbi:MAG: hypothetical protein V4675_20415 [Verrucomicrobiota bacterium]
MSRFHPLRLLQRRDAIALLLVFLGLMGLIRHLTVNPPPDPAPAPPAQASVYRAPLPPALDSTSPDAPTVPGEVKDMRRRLREFIVPLPGVSSLSVPDALALLQNHWQILPHETDAIPPATFTLDPAATDQLTATVPPPLVSLQIPGVSLLTNLRLLAAQADLKVTVTKTGAVLQTISQPASDAPQSAITPLDQSTINHYLLRANRLMMEYQPAGALEIETAADSGHASNVKVSVRLLKKEDGESIPDGQPLLFENTSDEPKADNVNDSYTIDLNLAPEEIEFEGFINHGTPIQTTGINALGESEPVILTDSKITQPVFATRILPDSRREALEKIFAPMGISKEGNPAGYSWTPLEGNLIATGSGRTLRVAATVATALEEAAHSGVKLEFLSADWQDNQPPPLPTLKAEAGPHRAIISATGRITASSIPAPSRIRFGRPLAVTVPCPPTRSFILLPEPGNPVHTTVEASGARFTARFHIDIPRPANFLFPAGAVNGYDSTPHIIHGMSCQPGQWHRLDLPASPLGRGTARQSIFVRMSRTTLPAD